MMKHSLLQFYMYAVYLPVIILYLKNDMKEHKTVYNTF